MTGPWFPGGKFDPQGWRLDIVSLLAVIGDSSVSIHAQEMTASSLCLLPRLIPAPQALLRSNRPTRLHAPSATITGVHSGVSVKEINFFANILLDIGELHPYEFRKYRISLYREKTFGLSNVDAEAHRADADTLPSVSTIPGKLGSNRSTMRSSTGEKLGLPMVPPRRYSPINIVSIVSCLMSVSAMVVSVVIGDGIALVAIVLISLASSMIGMGLRWRPRLATRPVSGPVPGGDVVIRTRAGAFVVVICEEKVARELYVGSEYCEYHIGQTWIFQTLSGIGTVSLMVAVVLLGNCSWAMQAVVGGMYILLNGLYWSISIMPKRYFWDMSRYVCEDITEEHLRKSHLFSEHERNPNFTRTLWSAIQATRSISWVRQNGATPRTAAWDKWLAEAYENRNNHAWPAERVRDRLMAEATGGASEPVSGTQSKIAEKGKSEAGLEYRKL